MLDVHADESPALERLLAAAAERGVLVEREKERISFAPYAENPTDKRQLYWLAYTSQALAERTGPDARILDIGSNVHWVIGLASGRHVEMLDVREHPLAGVLPFTMHAANATDMPLDDDAFDAVTFPQLLHWVGTGTYGDPVNISADVETMAEVARVLKPGGIGIFTTFVIPDQTVFKVAGRRLFSLPDLRRVIDDAGLDVVDLSLRDTSCQPITAEAIPPRTDRVLVPGNPDEDLAWAICTVRKR